MVLSCSGFQGPGVIRDIRFSEGARWLVFTLVYLLHGEPAFPREPRANSSLRIQGSFRGAWTVARRTRNTKQGGEGKGKGRGREGGRRQGGPNYNDNAPTLGLGKNSPANPLPVSAQLLLYHICCCTWQRYSRTFFYVSCVH